MKAPLGCPGLRCLAECKALLEARVEQAGEPDPHSPGSTELKTIGPHRPAPDRAAGQGAWGGGNSCWEESH